MLYNLKDMRVLEHSHLKEGFLVRFCIALEHPEDLIGRHSTRTTKHEKVKNE